MNNVYDVLKQEKQFLDNEGNIFKNKVCEYARKMDKSLLKLLYNNKLTRDLFFIEIDDLKVFDNQKFNNYIENKDFLPDSYTAFKNNIGLYDNLGNSINDCEDVVLQFPYKDCILEFDSTKESDKRNEIFFNETLMKKEIDVLLNPKVLTNAKRYDKNGISDITEISDNDNLIIKGNNLLALHSLLPRYKGMIKCMYWDILYNTNNDKVPYNDSFKHSSWLTMMKNRLDIAKKLLKPEGTIFLQCDDIEVAHLKVLCDEIFGRDNFLNIVTVKAKSSAGASGGGEDKKLKKNTEYILIYSKESFKLFNKIYTEEKLEDLIERKRKNKKNYEYNSVMINLGKKQPFSKITLGNGEVITVYKHIDYKIKKIKELSKEEGLSELKIYEKYFDKVFRTQDAQSSIRHKVVEATNNSKELFSIQYIPGSGRNKGRLTEILYYKSEMVNYLSNVAYKKDDGDIVKTTILGNLWEHIKWDGISKQGGVTLKYGKKPEELIKTIISMGTNEGDIILDAYLGSGTTAAVAHKMNRQYIGIEQLDSHVDKSLQRMQNVINGDQTGISKDVNWQGGGSFVYCELKKLSQLFIDKVNKASGEELISIYEELKDNQFVSYRVDINKVENNKKGFLALTEDKKRKLLIDIIDKNMLYVNYCDIEDEAYNVSQNDKLFNNSFYK